MNRRKIAFAAFRGRHAAHAADCDRARAEPLLGQRAEHDVERDAMAAHHHEIGQRGRLPDQRDARARAGIERGCQGIDLQKTIRLGEAA